MASKIFTTAQVLGWNMRKPRRKGGVLPKGVADRLKPDGLHVASNFHFYHEHNHSIRTQVLFAVKGTEEPLQTWVDIPMDDWMAAANFDDYMAAVKAVEAREAAEIETNE